MLNIGDSVGAIYKRSKDGKEFWELVEDKINKIEITKKYGRRYHVVKQFYALDADDVDNNTTEMQDAVGKGYIITREVFSLNDITRPLAEKWIKWANENPNKAVGLVSGE